MTFPSRPMKNFPRAVAAALCLLLAGCAVRLDLNPSQDIPQNQSVKNVDDLQQVLISAYASLGSEYFLGGSLHAWADVLSESVVINEASPYARKESAIARRNFNPNDSLIILAWEQGYRAVNLANHVISRVEDGSLSGEDYNRNRNRMLGEAYFIRGVAFFELLRWFAPAYSSSTAGLPSIPVPTSPSLSRNAPARVSLEEAYNQAKADLTRAAGLLPFRYESTLDKVGTFSVYGNATAAAAKGYLARIYFQQGGANNENIALQYINEVIGQVDSLRERVLYPRQFPMAGSDGTDNTSQSFNPYQSIGRSAFQFGSGLNLETEVIFQVLNRGDQQFSKQLFLRYSYDNQISETNPRYLVADSFLLYYFPSPLFPAASSDNRDLRFLRTMPVGNETRYNGRICFQKFLRSNNGYFNTVKLRSAELVITRAQINYNKAVASSDFATRRKHFADAVFDMFYIKKRVRRLGNSTARPFDNRTLTYSRLNDPTDATFEAQLGVELERERVRELFIEGDRLHQVRRKGMTYIPGNGQAGAENIPHFSLPLDQPILPIPVSEINTNRNFN